MDFLYELHPVINLAFYVILATLVVYAAKKISDCVDNIDKMTSIGGALIGGVFLAAVTSLPELFTSISSSIMDQPGLVFGNIFGSNLFNMFVLAVVDIIFIKHMFMNKIKSMRVTNLFTIVMYVVVLLPLALYQLFEFNLFSKINISLFNFLNLSLISVIIIIIYGFSIKTLATDQVAEKEEDSDVDNIIDKSSKEVKNQVKKEIGKFLGFSVLLVIFSIFLTMTVDVLSEQLNLGKSVAGALFLGAATSLPEMTAVIQLVRLRNYDAACGNIIGSNVFNFTILSVVDIIYGKEDIFLSRLPVANGSALYAESINVRFLVLFGIIAACVVMYMILRKKSKNKITYAIPSVLVILIYMAYLFTSFLIK